MKKGAPQSAAKLALKARMKGNDEKTAVEKHSESLKKKEQERIVAEKAAAEKEMEELREKYEARLKYETDALRPKRTGMGYSTATLVEDSTHTRSLKKALKKIVAGDEDNSRAVDGIIDRVNAANFHRKMDGMRAIRT